MSRKRLRHTGSMARRPWRSAPTDRREARSTALLQLAATTGWWFLAARGTSSWFVAPALLWTVVTVRSVVSWRSQDRYPQE